MSRNINTFQLLLAINEARMVHKLPVVRHDGILREAKKITTEENFDIVRGSVPVRYMTPDKARVVLCDQPIEITNHVIDNNQDVFKINLLNKCYTTLI